jgi:PAP_fibrillin
MGKQAASLVVLLLLVVSLRNNAALAFVIPVGTRQIILPANHNGNMRLTRQERSKSRLFVKPSSFDLFGAFQALTKQRPKASGAESVKNDLLAICNSDDDDVATKRKKVEAMLNALTTVSPISATAASSQLAKRWQVIWTTEKEINLFLDRGWAINVYQVINRESMTIENSIPFVNDRGSLDVKGTITPSIGCRTEFAFTAATLTIAINPWNANQKVQINLPPVGKGWFDTLYLDDTLRVDINSRNDILVCRPAK